MDVVTAALLMIPGGLGGGLAILGTIPFIKVLGGWQPKGATDVAFVAVPFIVGAIGMMSATAHLIMPES